MKQSNFLIIGGGIIGMAIARELVRRNVGTVTVLEKESTLGRHASGRNSGVIHSGINQKPGTLKAKMCVEGSRRLRDFCKKKKVPMNECGTLVVARNKHESVVLEQVLAWGSECGVPNLKLITREELIKREPLATGVSALLSPAGATVDSVRLLEAVAQEAESEGVVVVHSCEVRGISDGKVETSQGAFQYDFLINCAGLYADKMAHLMGVGREYRVIPFRGEYMEVLHCDVRSMIYPSPDLRFPFLGIHFTRETDGRLLAGPSAVLAFGREAYGKEWHFRDMLDMFLSVQFVRMVLSPTFLNLALQNAKTSLWKKSFFDEMRTLIPTLRDEDVISHRSGIRAQLVNRQGKLVNDLLIERTEKSLHVLNAVSPGMTCSLAFAEHVVNQILN